MTFRQKLFVGAGAVLVGAAVFKRDAITAAGEKVAEKVAKMATDLYAAAGRAAFALSVPSHVRPYANDILDIAKAKGVSPFALAAILAHESLGGRALDSHGTGDYSPRKRSTSWRPDRREREVFYGREGQGRVDWPKLDSATLKNTRWAMPSDGIGWGRGLMQIDFYWHYDWLKANDWKQPRVQFAKAADIYAEGRRALVQAGVQGALLEQAAFAAYNGGPRDVIAAIKQGVNPDTETTGGNYGAKRKADAEKMVAFYESTTGSTMA